jgi:hypothetical protein
MEKPMMNESLTIDGVHVRLVLVPYLINLFMPFGTHHSNTTSRTNALLLLVVDGELSGVGEVGLPPKKKDCYEADVEDIACYVQEYF